MLDLHRVVENPINISLIGTGIGRIPVKNFTESVYPSGLAVSSPEILLNMLDSIDTKAIHYSVSGPYIALAKKSIGLTSVVGHKILDPTVPDVPHLIALRVQISERHGVISQPTVFH